MVINIPALGNQLLLGCEFNHRIVVYLCARAWKGQKDLHQTWDSSETGPLKSFGINSD